MTGNWGQDFALLLKAAADAGLKVNWYTYYAGGAGGPTAIKQTGLDHQVFQITEGIPNSGNKAAMDFEKDFRAKEKMSLWYPRAVNEMRMFKAAAEKANSIDPVKVAAALEGMKFDVLDGGEGFMRKDDHQFFQPIYISSFGSLDRQGEGSVRRGKYRLGLAYGVQDRHRADHVADHLQDEAALTGRLRPPRCNRRTGAAAAGSNAGRFVDYPFP